MVSLRDPFFKVLGDLQENVDQVGSRMKNHLDDIFGESTFHGENSSANKIFGTKFGPQDKSVFDSRVNRVFRLGWHLVHPMVHCTLAPEKKKCTKKCK